VGGCKNGVLRKTFGSKGDDLTGGWRQLHDEQLHWSLNIIAVMNSSNMPRSVHVARAGKRTA
jgi:hypothetical protein